MGLRSGDKDGDQLFPLRYGELQDLRIVPVELLLDSIVYRVLHKREEPANGIR